VQDDITPQTGMPLVVHSWATKEGWKIFAGIQRDLPRTQDEAPVALAPGARLAYLKELVSV
jgi:hypothetical protein